MKYQIIYMSQTGNTEKIAKKIFEVLPGRDKDIIRFQPGLRPAEAQIVFIGFWVNRGTCSMDLLDYIASLHGKKIVLFATCGACDREEYYKKIMDDIKAWIPEDSECIDTFMCQGKMPMEVRDKYEMALQEERGDEKQLRFMIQNFDAGLTRPDRNDLEKVKIMVKRIVEKRQ